MKKSIFYAFIALLICGWLVGSGYSDNTTKIQWSELLNRQPFPCHNPAPPAERSAIDGTYTKIDPKQEPQVHCRRCPDYAPEGGLWKLQLDRGVFRIFHAVSGWKSIGHIAVEGDKLTLSNDPVCPDAVGVYTWKVEENRLVIEAIEDNCAIRLRAMNLTKQPWLSCRPPNREAAVTGHWPEPAGCQ